MDSLSDSKTSPSNDDSSCFTEAQEAFGVLLLSFKNKPDDSKPYDRSGTFRFLDLPRELRDRIYYYSLYRPQPYHYRRALAPFVKTYYPDHIVVNPIQPASGWNKNDGSHVTLFMTSPQIYQEAFEAFCSFNTFNISAKRELDGILRLFPQKPAGSIQRIRLTFRNFIWRRTWRNNTSEGSFAQMISESRLAKEYFPSLRECVCAWYTSEQEFEQNGGVSVSAISYEEKVDIITDWMKFWCNQYHMVPPKWLKVEYQSYQCEYVKSLEEVFANALERCKKEVHDNSPLDLEESGQKWLEEYWEEHTRGKRQTRCAQSQDLRACASQLHLNP
ncbi:hypothetical protein B0J11DRAFT_578817 [Dendryphion nanum]|uniref:Uncharacterized protein n=1 Tax=Dendryphion nanum TaxID=256645 RepID=A0A9P9E0H6_9PLEO|nr:hypothetical protein B0J11DRAFT_578817 [Dendryphion nanum]